MTEIRALPKKFIPAVTKSYRRKCLVGWEDLSFTILAAMLTNPCHAPK